LSGIFVETHKRSFVAFLALLLIVVVALIFLLVTEAAFEKIGFTRLQFALILSGTLIGSMVNIPLWRSSGEVAVPRVREVQAFWVTYRIPYYEEARVSTTVAINVGGAVIPILASSYLIATHHGLILQFVVATAVTSVLVHAVAKQVPGVGVVTPALLPPIFAAVAAFLLAEGSAGVVAYVAGTLGALIGADLSNMRRVYRSGAALMSIGGAGTFDGVFLTGIIAALIA